MRLRRAIRWAAVLRLAPGPRRAAIRWAIAILVASGAAILVPRVIPLPEWLRAVPPPTETLVFDRAGGLLARFQDAEERRSEPVSLDAVDPWLVRATLAAEDRRFFRHPGVDPLALARAVWRCLDRGEPLGGASTITMQVVRLARGRPRSFADRLAEVGWSFVLEAHETKEEILEAYLNRAPYGGDAVGVAAGARRWLGHSAALLSPAEAALLAALPRAPGRLDPARYPSEALAARDAVLRRMARRGGPAREEPAREGRPTREEPARRGRLDGDLLTRALASPLPEPARTAREAPHFAAWARSSVAREGLRATRIVTTLDPAIQLRAETALRRRLGELRDRAVRGGAVVVLDVSTSEVLAMVGSPDFQDPEAGQVNAALARRQPGSAVKPFTYVAAFAGELRPSTILADVPVSFAERTGVFAPRNYAGGFAGPVSARLALANSWNVPTLEAQSRAGAEEVARAFEAVGLPPPDPGREGLGITLGVGEVSLLDLAAAYATLARGGEWIAARGVRLARGADGALALEPPRRRAACDPIACSWVNEILADPAARAAAFGRGGPLELPGAVAAKTGTSSDWRDAWAILYTPRRVVAVWLGNPDGRPTGEVTGAEGPAVVAQEILLGIAGGGEGEGFPIPAGCERRPVCSLSGAAAGAWCGEIDGSPFRAGDPPLPPCTVHVVRRIDVATGRLARGCTPEARVRAVSFVRLPERFRLWQADRGLPVPPSEATECSCGDPGCGPLDGASSAPRAAPRRLALLRPVDGTDLAIDPTLSRQQQALALEAIAPAGVELTWRVDGHAIGRTREIHRLFWPIEAGAHVVEVAAGGERASSRVRVLSSEFDERPEFAGSASR